MDWPERHEKVNITSVTRLKPNNPVIFLCVCFETRRTCYVIISPEVHLYVVPLQNHATLCTGSSNSHIDIILIAESVNRQRLGRYGLMKDKICEKVYSEIIECRVKTAIEKNKKTKCPLDKAEWLRFFLPVEMHSLCRLVISLRRLPFISSGPAHTTSDTVALVFFNHVISHLARQSHSKALPLRSL